MLKAQSEPQGPESSPPIKRYCLARYYLARSWKNTSHLAPGKMVPVSTVHYRPCSSVPLFIPNQSVTSALQRHSHLWAPQSSSSAVWGILAELVPKHQVHTAWLQNTRMASNDSHISTAGPGDPKVEDQKLPSDLRMSHPPPNK